MDGPDDGNAKDDRSTAFLCFYSRSFVTRGRCFVKKNMNNDFARLHFDWQQLLRLKHLQHMFAT